MYKQSCNQKHHIPPMSCVFFNLRTHGLTFRLSSQIPLDMGSFSLISSFFTSVQSYLVLIVPYDAIVGSLVVLRYVTERERLQCLVTPLYYVPMFNWSILGKCTTKRKWALWYANWSILMCISKSEEGFFHAFKEFNKTKHFSSGNTKRLEISWKDAFEKKTAGHLKSFAIVNRFTPLLVSERTNARSKQAWMIVTFMVLVVWKMITNCGFTFSRCSTPTLTHPRWFWIGFPSLSLHASSGSDHRRGTTASLYASSFMAAKSRVRQTYADAIIFGCFCVGQPIFNSLFYEMCLCWLWDWTHNLGAASTFPVEL